MAGNVATDYELLAKIDSILAPQPSSLAWLVDAVRALRNDALSAVVTDKPQHFGCRSVRDLGKRDMLGGFNDAAQDGSPLGEGKHRYPVILVNQDVEGVVHNARFCGLEILKKIEVRPTVRTEGDQLPIYHRAIRKMFQGRRDVLKLLVQHILPARVESRFTSTPHDLKPIAVQLYFIGPLWTKRG